MRNYIGMEAMLWTNTIMTAAHAVEVTAVVLASSAVAVEVLVSIYFDPPDLAVAVIDSPDSYSRTRPEDPCTYFQSACEAVATVQRDCRSEMMTKYTNYRLLTEHCHNSSVAVLSDLLKKRSSSWVPQKTSCNVGSCNDEC